MAMMDCNGNDQVVVMDGTMLHSSGPIDLVYGSESPVNLSDVIRPISLAKKRRQPIEHLSFLGCEFNDGTREAFRAVGKKLAPAKRSMLGKKLKNKTDLKELAVKGVPDVGNDEISSLAPFLNNNSTLRSLDLTGASFNTKAIHKLRHFFRRNTSLEVLVLGENKCVGDEGVETIISALQIQAGQRKRLRKRRTGLSVLAVESCGITHVGAKCIANFMIQGGTSLQVLELSDNAIRDEGAETMAKSIERGSQLGHLGLNNADIGDRGAAAFGEVLKSNKALHTLSLQNNKGITSVGASSLLKAVFNTDSLKAIASSNHVLKNLNLSGCTNIGPDLLKLWAQLSAIKLLSSQRDIIRLKVSAHLKNSTCGVALDDYNLELMPHILEFVAKSNGITSLFQTLKNTSALASQYDHETYHQAEVLTEKEVHNEEKTPSSGPTFLRKAQKYFSTFSCMVPKKNSVKPTSAMDSDASEAKYLYHEVLPTDTFQGICLRYKLTPTELRRANKMLGSNLKLGPKKLLIPLSNVKIANINSRSLTRKEKTALLVSKVSLITKNKLTHSEARAYLDMADWDVDCAIEDVNGDFDWSSAHPYLFVGCRA